MATLPLDRENGADRAGQKGVSIFAGFAEEDAKAGKSIFAGFSPEDAEPESTEKTDVFGRPATGLDREGALVPPGPGFARGGRKLDVAAGGAIKGFAGSIGNILQLLHLQGKENLTPGQKALYEAEATVPEWVLPFLQEEDIAPRFSRALTGEEVGDVLGTPIPVGTEEKLLDALGQGFGSARFFGGGGKLSPEGALGVGVGKVGKGGRLARSLMAGSVAQEGAELVGLPPIASAIIGVGATVLTGGPPKGLVPKAGVQKQMVELLRKQGLTDAEIVPLTLSENRMALLGKTASGRQKIEKSLDATRRALGRGYEEIREAGESVHMTPEAAEVFSEQFEKTLGKMTMGQKRMAATPIGDFANSNMSFRAFRDLVVDINNIVGDKRGGPAVMGMLKDPAIRAMFAMDPELAGRFVLQQNAWAKLQTATRYLAPDKLTQWFTVAEIAQGTKALVTFDKKGIIRFIGVKGARWLSEQLLTNPKFQNLRARLREQVKGGGPDAARKALTSFLEEVKKAAPEEYEKFEFSLSEDGPIPPKS